MADLQLNMFRAAVLRTPDAVAIHYFDAALTYTEFDRLSDALAEILRRELCDD